MRKSLALVTGASKGIGKALAEELASRGYHLLMVARNPEELRQVSEEMSAKFEIEALPYVADLAEPTQVNKLIRDVMNQHAEALRILVNNAGYGMWGWFQDLPLEEQFRMMQVNVHTPVALSHALLPVLHQNGPSYILNISSSTAYQALPTMTVYAASKAFMVQFSRGLRHECDRQGLNVKVTCVSPGATKTYFIDRAGMEPLRKMADAVGMTPEAVAKIAIRAMFRGKMEVVPGGLNKLGAALARYLPKKAAENVAGNVYVRKLQKS